MTETVEQEIQRKGLTAPRITPEMVDAAIVGETFTILPSGRTTVCELTLRNGFTVRGESSVVSIENFDESLGQRVARANAKSKVWELEGYALRERLNANPRELAELFHDTYERLAPSFGYETRVDTRVFDPESKNGRLMVAVCREIQGLS